MEDVLDDSINNELNLKQRHGCVTAYLVFMIVINSLIALAYLFANQFVLEETAGSSPAMIYALGIIGIANVVFAVMLWKWKKIGFFGFIGTSLAAAALNIMMGVEISQIIMGLVGIAILYAILQIKQDGRSAWENMEN